MSSDKVNIDKPNGAFIDCVGGLDRAVKEWKINFNFLGKVVLN